MEKVTFSLNESQLETLQHETLKQLIGVVKEKMKSNHRFFCETSVYLSCFAGVKAYKKFVHVG